MARFADLAAGTDVPRESIEVEIAGKPTKIDLRLLSLAEEAAVVVSARDYAKTLGGFSETPSEADALYEVGLHRATIVLACLDPEDAEHKRPFFAAADLDHPSVSRELVAYLFARYQFLADKCSPRKLDVPEAEWADLVVSSGGGDPLPFCRLRPGAQWSFTASLARLLLGSPEGRSLYSAALLARSRPTSNSSAAPSA